MMAVAEFCGGEAMDASPCSWHLEKRFIKTGISLRALCFVLRFLRHVSVGAGPVNAGSSCCVRNITHTRVPGSLPNVAAAMGGNQWMTEEPPGPKIIPQ